MNRHSRVKRHRPSTRGPPHPFAILTDQHTLPLLFLQQTPLPFILQPHSLQAFLPNQRFISLCLLLQSLRLLHLLPALFIQTPLAFNSVSLVRQKGAHFGDLGCGDFMDWASGDEGFKDEGGFVADAAGE